MNWLIQPAKRGLRLLGKLDRPSVLIDDPGHQGPSVLAVLACLLLWLREGGHEFFKNSSAERPACLKMLLSVPTASSSCMGTTQTASSRRRTT